MLRLRIELMDQPGSLARVTNLLAEFRGDIAQIVVMHRGDGMAVDDIWMTMGAQAQIAEIRDAIARLADARCIGARQNALPIELDAQLDFLAYLFAAPQRSVEALLDMLPSVIDADWAAVRQGDGAVTYHSDGVDAGPLESRVDNAIVEFPFAGDVRLVVGRECQLPWHPTEVRRIASVLELGTFLIRNLSLATQHPLTALTRSLVDAPDHMPA
jgi:hypothetical protein